MQCTTKSSRFPDRQPNRITICSVCTCSTSDLTYRRVISAQAHCNSRQFGTKAGAIGSISISPLPSAGPRGWSSRTVAVTANVSIPSVGDLSGRRIYIEDVYPLVDAGRFPVKRIAGEPVEVWADIFRDGHAVLAAELLWRSESIRQMVARPHAAARERPLDGELHADRVRAATSTPSRPGPTLFATWRRDFLAKREAGMDVQLGDRGGPQSAGGAEAARSRRRRA